MSFYVVMLYSELLPLNPNILKIEKHPVSKIFGGNAPPGSDNPVNIASKVSFRSLKSKPQFTDKVYICIFSQQFPEQFLLTAIKNEDLFENSFKHLLYINLKQQKEIFAQ